MPVTILAAEAVRPVRQVVLRPHQSAAELVFAGDDHPLALHVGSVVGGSVLGVASIAPEPHPVGGDESDWRLRGMATLPEARGTGSGGELLVACLEHARAHGGRRVWCNARTGAVGFYERFGFVTQGSEFVLSDLGPHRRMVRGL